MESATPHVEIKREAERWSLTINGSPVGTANSLMGVERMVPQALNNIGICPKCYCSIRNSDPNPGSHAPWCADAKCAP